MNCGGWAAWVGHMGMYVPTWCAAAHGMFEARHRLAVVLLGDMGLPLHVMTWYVAAASWAASVPRQCDEVVGNKAGLLA